MKRLSLFWKVWLSTSVALTVIFAITAFVLQRRAVETTAQTLDEEVKAGFAAYDSVWRARQEMLASTAAILSSLPNVRAALGTRDSATIRDSTLEVWERISDSLKETAFFVVADPEGSTVASLDDRTPATIPRNWPVIRSITKKFPKQVAGFFEHEGQLFQLVVTPVYVQSGSGSALITVLLAGFPVNHEVAGRLRQATGGSEFVFASSKRVFASTLNPRASRHLMDAIYEDGSANRVSDGYLQYAPLIKDLIDVEGHQVGKLGIFRSFEAASQRMAGFNRDLVGIWVLALLAGLAITYMFVGRIVEPVRELDRAASELARENYNYRVEVHSEDELGRLASTFNSMSQSLQSARRELIRQERISTIGRLASSIVHDLRNPLAAIYGGAEMMVDTELAPHQVKRLAANIYQASRRIQEMLQDMLNLSRGKAGERDYCLVSEVIEAACEMHHTQASQQNVEFDFQVPLGLEAPFERSRVERVFSNLIANSLEAMPGGGRITFRATDENGSVRIEVADNGPGISAAILDQLFQPFATHGKKNGLGLGLALSRQTVLDHGGDIWAEADPSGGARFIIRFPTRAMAVERDRVPHPSTR